MRNISGILLILALLVVFMLPTLTGPAAPQAAALDAPQAAIPNITGTPMALPVFRHDPSPTPTHTSTWTPTPTRTATASPTVPPPQTMQGNLRREEPGKPSYATNIEDIWHWFWIRNNNPGRVYYGVLGVNVLYIEGGGCYGPNGYPCAGSAGAAEQRDKVIVAQPGTYTLSLHICQSSFSACTSQNGGGQWSGPLSQVQFVAIDWTPSAPTGDPTPAPEELCQLITGEPGGTYLHCKNLDP
jgi:hypothetical protein